MKPKEIAQHVLKEQTTMKDIETKITDMLHRIGVPANLMGYRYLCDAIVLAFESGKKALSVTKQIYPTVAKKNGTTAVRAERAMRNAIKVAWKRGDSDFQNDVFGFTIDPKRGKPTNSEFITMLAEKLRMETKE